MSQPVEERLVQACRALHILGLTDLAGQVSVRIPDTDRLLISPAPAAAGRQIHRLSPQDLVLVDLDGRTIEGAGLAPQDVLMHCEVYRRRPDVLAIVHTHQVLATAFATARRPLVPIGHIEADLAMRGTAFWGSGEIADTPGKATSLAAALDAHPVLMFPCHGVLCAGRNLEEAVMRTHHLELLAEFNLLAVGLGGPVRAVTEAAYRRIAQQRARPEQLAGFYASVVEGVPPAEPRDPWPEGSDVEATVRARMELACQILFHFGLVAHREHVTNRLSGDRFLMSPRGHLGRLKGSDMATLDMDCNWLAGPLPPPPFMWFHRDILAARRDVQAIVHTHPVFGRILPVLGIPLKPVHQVGAWQGFTEIPVYEEADMVFEEPARRGVLSALGGAPIVHELHHGIDFVAPTLEQATVWAVHHEMLSRRQYLASRLGTPSQLPGPSVADGASPPDTLWWEYYVSILDEPPAEARSCH